MKHVFVTQDFGPDLGGMARRHVELCRRFAPDELIVSTVAQREADAFDSREPYTIHRQPFPFGHANRFTNQVRWAASLAADVVSGVDLVHCGNIRPCGYVVWLARARVRRPYVLYVNGGDLLKERDRKMRNPMKRRAARWIFGGACGVVAISAWTAELAREVMGRLGLTRRPPVRAIPLGTDPVQFAPRCDTGALRRRFSLGTRPVMLTVARLVPHKGQDVAIRALARLSTEFPALRYVVVGEGPDGPRLAGLARELGMSDRLVLAGRLSDHELADAYATSTVYVGPSRVEQAIDAEGFGLSFVEAAASGVPSVAGDSGGVRSAVRDGETGLVVPPTDADAVAGGVRTFLHDETLRRRFGACARLAVEEYFNWDRVARDTLAFARAAAQGGGHT